jgi:type VI secretion system secreted protein Hcp
MKKKINNRLVVQIAIAIGITSIIIFGIMSNPLVNSSTANIAYPPFSAVSMNLFIEGVDGESKISGRENSVDILGYSHSINNPFDLATGDTSVAQHSPLRVMKYIDKSSVKLMEKCVQNAVIPTVTLRFYLEPSGLNFYQIELTNALVTSYQGFGTIYSGEIPRETVSFTYESIKWTYTEYDEEGASKGNVEAQDTWDQTPPG